jgi:hypothetical protein
MALEQNYKKNWQEFAKHSDSKVVNSTKFLELQCKFLKYLFCCSKNSKKSKLDIEFRDIYPSLLLVMKKTI